MATTPPHIMGPVAVSVTTPGGSARPAGRRAVGQPAGDEDDRHGGGLGGDRKPSGHRRARRAAALAGLVMLLAGAMLARPLRLR